ncbi:MAG TPA: maleylpyruvate isomerase family mycothiol-dependent enzyme [Pseudonocardiaceae bacterium]|jgi:uncharacterized protein (TIGR03083 family)|nr:maleylpyruvate isomerase family mycothiol-dependent enzyme [Pseudonocardiaceae bacterium]
MSGRGGMLPGMETSAFTDTLRTQGELLGDAAARTGLAAAVPSCPEWTLRDLLLHVGGVHRWAATVVGEARAEPLGIAQPYDIVDELPADEALVDWYRAGHAELVATLDRAPADLACWAFLGAPTPLAFWARRQTHETAIHRVDAELAAGDRPTTAPPEVATDGVDELLMGFLARGRRWHAQDDLSLHISTTDTDGHWLVRTSENRPLVERAAADAAAERTVSGPANDVYLALWNRTPWDGLDVTGATPAELAEQWAGAVHVRWG